MEGSYCVEDAKRSYATLTSTHTIVSPDIKIAKCTAKPLLLYLLNAMSDVRVVLITRCSEGGIRHAL